ncbi:MAG: ribose 5-phosphate isomerase B [Bacteroidetes bacterium RIFOXYA12_FULL_35_11]|nr:MAG: ribose 5-phosphate isomerase B [Bacteroidetes bacterium GWF2_35_48]OFY75276.1 MAG: ribose 5-phosphate isomerase B [Bacteroidetes bacterium RIFOXYA12_FULL_35_11]OFY96287.1 MAG: ribose 5-phosphate isomerase B [Bacteroidetes bacterium RIFOXYC12_FULL_35_7]OFY97492.1 MAG: ribose 5-phosphate isomerase B [Bacteroidetes bacterium RIFOXYB2_FULL_35_7]HBX51024.1 ribose 5-phosphate isomerase B [Bacteroidales bacterium]
MKIAIACDHAAFKTKEHLKKILDDMKVPYFDFGTHSEESCDYPDFAHPLAKAIEEGKYDLGITLCGSGNGINMVVNKYQKIRGALCWNTEIAKLARTHNNANVCAIPARFVRLEDAEKIMKVFLNTKFEGGRHQVRIDKIPVR